MSVDALKRQTYLPVEAEPDRLAEVYDFFAAHETAGRRRPAPRYYLTGTSAGDRVEIPAEVYRILRHVVEAMRQGMAVTVAPQSKTLTTQQAADLLGISRPTLVKLLDEGRIPHERVGSHRRVLLRDVLAFRDQRRAEQYAMLETTAVEPDDEEDLSAILERLRSARRVVTERRRRRQLPPT